MRRSVQLVLFGSAALLVAGCHRHDRSPASDASTTIAWREGDVDDAFAEAKATNKPVLLYWGAKWCPPCNVMKETLFKDPAFIAEAARFIPVHLDGDAKNAQLWGDKFSIRGYPTVIILTPDRAEITRLAGGATASALADALRIAAKRTTPIEDVLRRARDPKSLSPEDWEVLAGFDWRHDPVHFSDLPKAAPFYAQLADAAPDPAMARHFALTSLIMARHSDDNSRLPPADQTRLRAALPSILTNYDEAKANRQELSYGTASLILGLSDTSERDALGHKLVSALDRIADDSSLSLDDRLVTVEGEIALSKGIHGGKAAADVMAKLRRRVAAADKSATNPMARQAVMYDAGEALADAGDFTGAERLMKGELPRAIGSYLYMLDLGGIAEERKDYKTAIGWLRKAALTAQGPATRVQWATIYSNGVIRMTPDDKAAVEASGDAVISTLATNDSGYAERTAKRATAWASKMQEWSAQHGGSAVLARLEAKMDAACARGGCKNVLKS
jgi:protein disulfide-isomerase